jgi:arylsulfatase A-like enzyme
MLPLVENWLGSEAAEPFFLYFHCTDPHYPYAPPQRFARWGYEEASDRYDGAILFVDEYFQRLLSILSDKKLLENTVVIFTADHGEEWGEHGGSGHGHTLYNELLHVPLILAHPSFVPGRRAEPVRLVDLYPTLVELCGLATDASPVQGRSLAGMLRQGEVGPPRATFNLAEVFYPSKMDGIAYERDGWKLIWTRQDRSGKRDRYELYNTLEDPFEQVDLAASEPARLAQLIEEAQSRRGEFGRHSFKPTDASLDEATRKALENLGYAQ